MQKNISWLLVTITLIWWYTQAYAIQANIFDVQTQTVTIFDIQESKVKVITKCGNWTIDEWEQCEDGNFKNNDGCDSNCRRSRDYTPECGNDILDEWEQCDGQSNCSDQCTLNWWWGTPDQGSDQHSSPPEQYTPPEQQDLYQPNDATDNTTNNQPFNVPDYSPPTRSYRIPNVWPEDSIYARHAPKNIKRLNTRNVSRFPEDLEKTDENHGNPLYRIKDVLPNKYQSDWFFLVIPSIKTVARIYTTKDKEFAEKFELGVMESIDPLIREQVVHYMGNTNIQQTGSNIVLLWHSSQSYANNDEREETQIGNVFKYLPVIEDDAVVYFVKKYDDRYDVHAYLLWSTHVIEPEKMEILESHEGQKSLTLVTCYPNGSNKYRFAAQAQRQFSYEAIISWN